MSERPPDRRRIEVALDGQLVEDLGLVDRAVIGAALPPPDVERSVLWATCPGTWRSVAAEWLRESGCGPLMAGIISVEASLGWDQLDAYLSSEVTAEGFRVSKKFDHADGMVVGKAREMGLPVLTEDRKMRRQLVNADKNLCEGCGWSSVPVVTPPGD